MCPSAPLDLVELFVRQTRTDSVGTNRSLRDVHALYEQGTSLLGEINSHVQELTKALEGAGLDEKEVFDLVQSDELELAGLPAEHHTAVREAHAHRQAADQLDDVCNELKAYLKGATWWARRTGPFPGYREFGHVLRLMREDAEHSQGKLAKKVRETTGLTISGPQISHLETHRERRRPALHVIAALARTCRYRLTLSFVPEGEPTLTPPPALVEVFDNWGRLTVDERELLDSAATMILKRIEAGWR